MRTSGEVGRRLKDEADARACLAAASAARVSPHVWAGMNGVATRSLSQWRRRIEVLDGQAAREKDGRRVGTVRATATSASLPRLVEVALGSPPIPASTARYVVVAGRYRVLVGEDFTEETLARLLRVVVSC